jgi:hypothetical protein
MRKSENTPAAASRPATKHQASRHCGCDAKRDGISDRVTTGRARAQGGQLRAVLSIAGPARRRGRVGNAAQARLAAPYLLLRLVAPGVQSDLQAFESLRPSIEARGASLVSISQQTVTENAKVHVQIEAGFSDSLGPRRVDCPAVRRALAHSGAPPRHPLEERDRPATPQRRRELDAADPGPLYPR